MVAGFWAIAVIPATTLPMTDPDTFWHIRAGREFLAGAGIPTTDTWSIAGQGRPWVSQDWLSNVVMAWGFGAGTWGPSVLSVLYGVIGAAALWLLWNAIGVRSPGIGWLARSGWLLFGLVLAAPVLGVRVQVIDLFLAAVVVNVLWRYLRDRRRWILAVLPVAAVAWVNLHAGFPLLFLIAGAVVVGEAIDRWLTRQPDGAPLTWGEIGWLTGALAVAGLALVLNPNGVAIYTYPFDTLGIDVLGSFVGEWQPARLTAPAGQLLAAFVLVGILPTLVLGHDRLRTGDGLVLVGLTFMAVTAVRFLLVAGPIGAAIVCLALAPIISASRFGRSGSRTLARLGRTRRGTAAILTTGLTIAVVVAGIGLAALRVAPAAQANAVAETYPVDAVSWLEDNRPGERIFNRYEWGGYLGLRLPDRPIFIDGRADVYDDEILLEYVDTISVVGDPQETFDRYGIDHILYPADSTLGRWLNDSDDWEVVYADDVASVWVCARSRADGSCGSAMERSAAARGSSAAAAEGPRAGTRCSASTRTGSWRSDRRGSQ